MAPRYRALNRDVPAAQLPAEKSFAMGQLVAELTLRGSLIRYTRNDGREVVRLTLNGLFPARAEVWAQTFGAGTVSSPRQRADGEPRTSWHVEGRWACLRVLEPFMTYLAPSRVLHDAAVELLVTSPQPRSSACALTSCGATVYARGLCRGHHRVAAHRGLLTAKSFGRPGLCTLCGATTEEARALCRECAGALTVSPDAT